VGAKSAGVAGRRRCVGAGGENDPINLTTLCDGHHGMHHEGLIQIAGQAPDAILFSREGRPIAYVP
jgi:hypothetical protein